MAIHIVSFNNPYLDSLLFQSTFPQPITRDAENQVLNDDGYDQQMHAISKQKTRTYTAWATFSRQAF